MSRQTPAPWTPMATWEDVRRIASSLPETSEKRAGTGPLAGEGQAVRMGAPFASRPTTRHSATRLRRADSRGPGAGPWGQRGTARRTTPRCSSRHHTSMATPSVLVPLGNIDASELEDLMVEAWLDRAPKRLAKDYLDSLK